MRYYSLLEGTYAGRSARAPVAHGSPHSDVAQGLEISLRDVLQHQLLQAQVGHDVLELRILRLQLLHAALGPPATRHTPYANGSTSGP